MKFTIRDLLLVTLIVGLALGWGVDRWRLQAKLKARLGYIYACLHRLEEHGETVMTTDGDAYFVRANDSDEEWKPFFTASENKLRSVQVRVRGSDESNGIPNVR